jgi:hypothetical protein
LVSIIQMKVFSIYMRWIMLRLTGSVICAITTITQRHITVPVCIILANTGELMLGSPCRRTFGSPILHKNEYYGPVYFLYRPDFMYIYDFPEMRPGIYVCNIGWLRDIKTMLKKMAPITSITQILVEPWLGSWSAGCDHLHKCAGLPITQMDDAGPVVGALVMYDTRCPRSVAAFEKEFECKLGEYGIITLNKDEREAAAAAEAAALEAAATAAAEAAAIEAYEAAVAAATAELAASEVAAATATAEAAATTASEAIAASEAAATATAEAATAEAATAEAAATATAEAAAATAASEAIAASEAAATATAEAAATATAEAAATATAEAAATATAEAAATATAEAAAASEAIAATAASEAIAASEAAAATAAAETVDSVEEPVTLVVTEPTVDESGT